MGIFTKQLERKEGGGYFFHYSPKTMNTESCTGNCAYGQNETVIVDDREFDVIHASSEKELKQKIESYETGEALKLSGGVFGTQKSKKAAVREPEPVVEEVTPEAVETPVAETAPEPVERELSVEERREEEVARKKAARRERKLEKQRRDESTRLFKAELITLSDDELNSLSEKTVDSPEDGERGITLSSEDYFTKLEIKNRAKAQEAKLNDTRTRVDASSEFGFRDNTSHSLHSNQNLSDAGSDELTRLREQEHVANIFNKTKAELEKKGAEATDARIAKHLPVSYERSAEASLEKYRDKRKSQGLTLGETIEGDEYGSSEFDPDYVAARENLLTAEMIRKHSDSLSSPELQTYMAGRKKKLAQVGKAKIPADVQLNADTQKKVIDTINSDRPVPGYGEDDAYLELSEETPQWSSEEYTDYLTNHLTDKTKLSSKLHEAFETDIRDEEINMYRSFVGSDIDSKHGHRPRGEHAVKSKEFEEYTRDRLIAIDSILGTMKKSETAEPYVLEHGTIYSSTIKIANTPKNQVELAIYAEWLKEDNRKAQNHLRESQASEKSQ